MPGYRLLLFGSLLLLSACSTPEEPIESYTIRSDDEVFAENSTPKAAELRKRDLKAMQPKKPEKARMLGLILIDDANGKGWFFKLTGPVDEVMVLPKGESESPFLKFAKSIRFLGGRPDWTVPANWRQLPKGDPRNNTSIGPRYATILTGKGEDAPPLTVNHLPRGDFPIDRFVLDNVNRWRRQLGLSALTEANLYQPATDEARKSQNVSEVVRLTIDGKPAFLVQLTGVRQTQGGPPFMMRR